MSKLFDLLMKQMSGPFVGGGLVLMFTGSLIALARRLPALRDAMRIAVQ